MPQFNPNAVKTFEADAAVAQYARVNLDADGKVTTSGLADHDIGVAMEPAFAAGDKIAVRLRNAPGTTPMIAIEALAVGALVYSETAGKVQDTSQATSFAIGTAMEAATADDDVIEVLRHETSAAEV